MPLPEIIPVKYTEEEAEYISMRPLVRQEFRSAELVDMIVQVAGKDPDRVQKILSAGTVVFHSFRYWWAGFDADTAALSEILKNYPDSDPQRAFRAKDCTEVILESRSLPAAAGLPIATSPAAVAPSQVISGLAAVTSSQTTESLAAVASSSSRSPSPPPASRIAGSPVRHSVRIRRDDADRRKLLRSRSVWDLLMNLACEAAPIYREYSYSLRGDIYALPLSAERAATLAKNATEAAPRALRAELAALPKMSQIVFLCPRSPKHSTTSPI